MLMCEAIRCCRVANCDWTASTRKSPDYTHDTRYSSSYAYIPVLSHPLLTSTLVSVLLLLVHPLSSASLHSQWQRSTCWTVEIERVSFPYMSLGLCRRDVNHPHQACPWRAARIWILYRRGVQQCQHRHQERSKG